MIKEIVPTKLSFLLLAFTWLCSITCHSNNFTQVEILKEESREYHLKEVFEKKSYFQPFKSDFSRNKKSYWLRFSYSKKDNQNISYLLAPYILYQKLDLYYQLEDSLYHFQSGVSLDYEKRNLPLPNLYLQLPNSSKQITCWLHVIGFYNYSFFFDETTDEQLIANEFNNSYKEHFLIGLSFLAGLFGLVFYFFLKDRLYLYYGLFSFFLILSRLTYSGNIFKYVLPYLNFSDLESIYTLFAISYSSVNLALLLYFGELIRHQRPFQRFNQVVYFLALFRFGFLVVHLIVGSQLIDRWIDSRIVDLIIQFFLLFCTLKSSRNHFKQSILATCSILLLILGNLLYILADRGLFNLDQEANYGTFLNLAGIEVVVFAMLVAYRNHSLKKEHDAALLKIVDNLRASEAIKDQLNKELEIKVLERTEQIRKMNEILKTHNIELKSEVNVANEARVFQKIMNFKDFEKFFPDEESCYHYLAKLKWKDDENYKCKKCGYEGYTNIENLSRRCRRCRYVESVTNGTLFHRLKFPILKAFYINYRTSVGTKNDTTQADIAEEISLREATLSKFRQKILAIMEANAAKRKHKDGWTHLIEYSIEK